MENLNHSPSKVWILFGASTVGMLIFAGLYFANPKTSTAVQAGPTIITNTMVNTFTNEVIKEISKIPEEYIQAAQAISNYDNADFIDENQVLFEMKDVQTIYLLSDPIKQIISEDEIRAKIELTLRKNNVPVNPKSKNIIEVNIGGFIGNPPLENLLIYNFTIAAVENRQLVRNGKMHRAILRVWSKNMYGTVGKNGARTELQKTGEELAELFANDFLSANPQPQQ